MKKLNVKREDVFKALEYIDKNGVEYHNESTKYNLVSEDGKRYPPKYVIAVAIHIANGTEISTDGFNSTEAKKYLENLGFIIETKQQNQNDIHYKNRFSSMLLRSNNIIFHGAPGTGKSYLAKQIAADIITDGNTDNYYDLSDEQKRQVEFVQFHPSYDYSDFVEGLRPKKNDDGTIGFDLQDGIFKKFADRAGNDSKEKYVFIIDEINRGEISKIFGELFFAIDPGYRGKAGEITTQYANLHSNPNEKFYIPENVYIIGTMNDIDRSVDSFDFAMRRRFRFIEIKVNYRLEMLDNKLDKKHVKETIDRMRALNHEISNVEDLGKNYQIGAAYFLKLKNLGYDFDKLWTDYLEPLLADYIRGMNDEAEIMRKFEKAYKNPVEGGINESAYNQG